MRLGSVKGHAAIDRALKGAVALPGVAVDLDTALMALGAGRPGYAEMGGATATALVNNYRQIACRDDHA